MKIVRYLFLPFILLGIGGFVPALYQVVLSSIKYKPQIMAFGVGGIIFFFSWWFYFSRRAGFWGTVHHELTHALFALLFLRKVHSISASRRRGGLIRMEGGNLMIALAPYFFPLLSMIIISLKLLAQPEFQIYLSFLLGFSYLGFVFNVVREFHAYQPDLQIGGFFLSIIYIFFFNLISCGVVLSSLPGEVAGIFNYLKSGLILSIVYSKQIINTTHLWEIGF